jgi:hypothetical protein
MEGVTAVLAIGLMVLVMFLSIIPFLPGPALVWTIGMIYAALTSFTQITPVGAAIMTVLMVVGATTEFWLPFFGVSSHGMSCLGAVGSIIGGIIGTFVIPLPLLGTLLGSIAGALLFEFARLGQWRQALTSGRVALQLYLLSIIIEFGLSLLILIVFVIALLTG